MTVKLFIIGRPGCGKSEAARYIISCVETIGLSTLWANDYGILQEMFQADKEHKFFLPLTYASEGHDFDVVDFTVLDKSLQEVEKRALEQIDEVKLLIIEFARKNYSEVLKRFDPTLLHNAYFLYIETDVDTCALRVYDRAAHPRNPDDHYVSDKIIKNYYKDEGEIQLLSDFAADNNIPDEQVKIINNAGSLQDFTQQIFSYIYAIFSREEQLLPDTDPAQFVPTFIHDYDLQCE